MEILPQFCVCVCARVCVYVCLYEAATFYLSIYLFVPMLLSQSCVTGGAVSPGEAFTPNLDASDGSGGGTLPPLWRYS